MNSSPADPGDSMTPSTPGSGNTDTGNTTPPPAGGSDAGAMMPGGDPPTGTPSDGALYSGCSSDDDCGDGLNCYEFGGYCGTACAEDADCASLGEQFGCSGAGGGGPGGGFPGGGGPGGGFPGGGMADGGMSTAEADGACRATCEGEDDTTSCPGGLTCMSLGGGGPGGGGETFRCALPDAMDDMGGDMEPAGDVPAFGECMDDSDCADGLGCSAMSFGGGGGGTGYCTQDCMEDEDCTEQPGSGSASVACGFGGQCTLSCADDENACPDGMSCNMFGGGGGGGAAFCNY